MDKGINLDERLQLAYDLYEPCRCGADIGTDHGLLPCALLLGGKCDSIVMTDISEKALAHARAEVARRRLENRARLVCGDGLAALDVPCGCISVTGMGGRTVAQMLLAHPEKLRGAVLILSAHTDLPLVRAAVYNTGYHLTAEELCFAAGRYYTVFRAEPGAENVPAEEIRLGRLIFDSRSPHLPAFIRHRIRVLEEKLSGLEAAGTRDEAQIAEVREDLARYEEEYRKHEST